MNGFEDEIRGQPQSLKDAVKFYADPARGGALLKQCQEKFIAGGYSQVIFTGMGSSYYDGLLGTYFLSSVGIPCRAVGSGEISAYFSLNNHPSFSSPLIIAISQSGESGEIVEFIRRRNKNKETAPTMWAITNFPESTLGSNAELCLPLVAGKEDTVTSKTYICGLVVIWLLSQALAGESSIVEGKMADLGGLIAAVESLFQDAQTSLNTKANEINAHLEEYDHIHFIGQGTSLSTVGQATLNIKELAKINAEGLSIGMFRHGAQEIIDDRFRCIITVADHKAYASAQKLINKILDKWGNGRVVLITNSTGTLPDYPRDRVLVVRNPITNPYLAPVYEIVILQGYMCRVTRDRGLVPGEFRYTQKVTK